MEAASSREASDTQGRLSNWIRRAVRSWPTILSSMVALVPLAMLVAVVALVVKYSLVALDYVGLHEMLFTSTFRESQSVGAPFSYGLLGAIWNTMVLLIMTMTIAAPVSLAMAIFASEFPSSFLGKRIREALGVLSGIPPVVYALVAVLFLSSTFTIPNRSLLTGGVLLALLVIPFMAPLMDDALQNTPGELREASLALGATRWYTLRNATLPSAMPGIISALAMGSMKAMGDVIIAMFAIGYAATLPSQLWKVTGPTAPLTSSGAWLVGSFSRAGHIVQPGTQAWVERSVGYFAALVLLALAMMVLLALSVLQRRYRRMLKTPSR